MVTFQLFARPVIDALAGVSPRKPTFLKARLKAEIKTKTGLTRFLPALLSGEFENAEWNWRPGKDRATLRRWPGGLLCGDSSGSREDCGEASW